MAEFQLQAACAFGLEAIVKRELIALGYEARVAQPGRVGFTGDWSAICKTNLWLRVADRVLIVVKQFPAADFDQLFETTKAIDWQQYLPQNASFPVTGRSRNSQLTSVPACQRSVKKAISLSMSASYGGELPDDGSLYKIDVALLDDQATLTMDTTGSSLHKRGYRKLVGEAPLKETLAAALVQLSFWKPGRPLIDPFCGSGTIPIEAALIGLNVAPGLKRKFAAEGWDNFKQSAWNEQREAAKAEIRTETTMERILGTDIDGEVLSLARYHAEQAGVEHLIHWQQRPFDELRSKKEFGCLIANPPYGERLGDSRHLKELYQSIPQVLSRLPTWSHYILTGFPEFERVIRKSADRRRKLYNGRIECMYYQYHGPRPPRVMAGDKELSIDDSVVESESVEKVVSETPKKQPAAFGELGDKANEQSELFATRLVKRARHLRRWPTRQGITCFRLYDRDIPEIPLVVDRYENCLHITEYERPSDRDLGQQASWLELMAKTAGKAFEVERKNIFVKSRHRQSGDTQHEKVADNKHRLIVCEGGLKFAVNLSDFVDTGLFLDHRITRSMVREAAAGKRFLNLFAYTGSFSVYAAAGGAKSTTTVDWSNTYLNWARDNMSLNGFVGDQHVFERQDVAGFVQALPEEPLFDLAVIDPPTFSNSKRSEQEWDVQRDHVTLIQAVATRMASGSTIYFSTNFRRFKLDEQLTSQFDFREISKQTVPEDFRNRRIHRCWRVYIA